MAGRDRSAVNDQALEDHHWKQGKAYCSRCPNRQCDHGANSDESERLRTGPARKDEVQTLGRQGDGQRQANPFDRIPDFSTEFRNISVAIQRPDRRLGCHV